MNNNITLKQRSYHLSVKLIKTLKKVKFNQIDSILINQIVRSATSIGANLVEAQGASSRKDYTNFFSYSLKSSRETLFWLQLLKDVNILSANLADELIQECTEISKLLGASIVTLKKNNLKK